MIRSQMEVKKGGREGGRKAERKDGKVPSSAKQDTYKTAVARPVCSIHSCHNRG